MASFTADLGTGYTLHLDISEGAPSIPANTSPVAYSAYITKGTGSGKWSSYTNNSWSVNIGGQTAGGSGTYDFRTATVKALLSGTVTIAHNSDGSRTIAVSASFSDPHSNLGSNTAGGNVVLAVIPRASTPTFSPSPVDAGSVVTITTNRASSGFTHDISYSIGASSGSIGTGVGASTTWTPPLSLLAEIPNSAQGSVAITTNTYNGATLIGTTNTTMLLTAPSTAVPDFTTVTKSDTNSSVVSNVGAYVQGLSTLALAITGAAGIYGSTIVSYKIEVAGQTINAVSGTTTPLMSSGTYNITGTVTDSRGRSKSKTVSITVLAYTPPLIDSSAFALSRSDAAGTLEPDSGTYVRTDLKASVQSLIVATVEKNALTYKIESRLRGDTSWTTKATVTPGGITFNSFDVEGTYAVEEAWEFQVTVSDKFNSAVIGGTVATAAIFMHWGEGLAVGKFWEQGGLDVKAQIYQNDGKAVLDVEDLATDAEAIAGTSTTKVVTPHALSAVVTPRTVTGVVSSTWTYGTPSVTLDVGGTVVSALIGRYEPQPGDAVVLEKIGATYYIVAPGNMTAPKFLKQLPLSLASGWIIYDDSQQGYGEPVDNASLTSRANYVHVSMSSTGIVKLTGFVIGSPAPSAGSLITTLPVGMRPARTQVFPADSSGLYGNIYVNPDGTVRYLSGTVTTYLALDVVTFRSAAMVTAGAATFVAFGTMLNSWVPYTTSFGTGDAGGAGSHTPGYTIDADGVVLFEGAISSGANGTNVFQCTGLSTQLTDLHLISAAGSTGNAYFRFGGTGGTGTGNFLFCNTSGAWNSLAGIVVMPSSSTTTWLTPQFYNSWAQYSGTGSSYNLGQIAKTPEGLVLCRGMIASGTVGANSPMWILSKGYRPRYQALSLCTSNAALGVLYKGINWADTPDDRAADSGISLNNGSNVWVSMANLNWFAYK